MDVEFSQAIEHLSLRINRLQYMAKKITLAARLADTNISCIEELHQTLAALDRRMTTLEGR
jgi:hypothetical protein